MSVLVIWLVAGTAIAVGLVVYANYWSCDPMKREIIAKKDELVTLFVLEHLVEYVGVPGIFIASLLCGALRYIFRFLHVEILYFWSFLDIFGHFWSFLVIFGNFR